MADAVASLSGKHCLVLDDEYLIALDIQQVLEAAGAASVTSVASVEEALAALRAGVKFDLAVLDIRLTGAAGGSMAVAALLSEQRIPFVFLTGVRADEIQAGPFPHAPVVEKPFQASVLIATVRRALVARSPRNIEP